MSRVARCSYPVSTGFFLAWLLAFVKLLLFNRVNKPTTSLTEQMLKPYQKETSARKIGVVMALKARPPQ